MEIAEGGDAAGQPEEQEVEIPNNTLARLEKVRPRLEDALMNLSATLVEAEAAEMQEHTPPAMRKSGQKAHQEATKLFVKIVALIDNKKGKKSEFKAVVDPIKTTMTSVKELNHKLKKLLKDAAEAEEEE